MNKKEQKKSGKRIKIHKDPYGEWELFAKSMITINPGLTVLVGCNGSGKTTIMRTISRYLREKDVPYIEFNNLSDGGQRIASRSIFYGDVTTAASAMCSSEGERINIALNDFIRSLGRFVNRNRGMKEIWVLIDALDSGYSIDNIVEFKEFVKDTLFTDTKDQDVYVVVTCNQYEVAEGEDCIDVQSCEHVKIGTYEEYREFILETRKKKDEKIATVGEE